jgi:hypothetical protein
VYEIPAETGRAPGSSVRITVHAQYPVSLGFFTESGPALPWQQAGNGFGENADTPCQWVAVTVMTGVCRIDWNEGRRILFVRDDGYSQFTSGELSGKSIPTRNSVDVTVENFEFR